MSTIKELHVDSDNNIPMILRTINNNYSLAFIFTISAIRNAHVANLKKAYFTYFNVHVCSHLENLRWLHKK